MSNLPFAVSGCYKVSRQQKRKQLTLDYLMQDVRERDYIAPPQPRKRRRLVKLAGIFCSALIGSNASEALRHDLEAGLAETDEQARAKAERSSDTPLRLQRAGGHVIDSDSDDTHVIAIAEKVSMLHW